MFRLAMLLYNLILPLGFIVFLPGLIYKLIARPGWKKTFMERFGCFGGRKNELSGEGGIWFHAVSVGETMVALSVIRELLKRDPDCRIILSTTTTTGQQLARAKAPEQVTVIGGKTGTTSAAGSCLILLARDTAGSPYISVILKATARDVLYEQMTRLLNVIA